MDYNNLDLTELIYKMHETKAEIEYHKSMANFGYMRAVHFPTKSKPYFKYMNRHAYHARKVKEYENTHALLVNEYARRKNHG